MEVVENAQFSNILISKMKYENEKFQNNDPLGKTKANFYALKDYYTYQLNFENQELLNNFVDQLSKAKSPERLTLKYLFYNYGMEMEMERKIQMNKLLSVFKK